MFQVGRKEKSCMCFIHDMDNCFFMCVCVGGWVGYGCIRAEHLCIERVQLRIHFYVVTRRRERTLTVFSDCSQLIVVSLC